MPFDVRVVAGWLAYVLLLGYWALIISSTAPQLRRGNRDRALRTRVLLVRTVGVLLTAFVVAVIQFWAAGPVDVLATLVAAGVAGTVLRRQYRLLVAAPRHRLSFARRLHRRRHHPHARVLPNRPTTPTSLLR